MAYLVVCGAGVPTWRCALGAAAQSLCAAACVQMLAPTVAQRPPCRGLLARLCLLAVGISTAVLALTAAVLRGAGLAATLAPSTLAVALAAMFFVAWVSFGSRQW